MTQQLHWDSRIPHNYNDLKEECFAIINNFALAANLARYSALPETRQEWLSLFGNILLRYICILIDELHQ